ncbi:type IV pilus modification protein PilV [Xylophilus rhododendri]|uniref:Type IV pilus modification protein PilV n=1 Tax=Xylophilus rhododendri TaxID=2697032 RepID=A0A857J310_9BURK|nr:type IV pilus modification protein PilV [Xylophilus rhododendri]QHI98156.1 type IV pilus modification protein PilV [Xylophilus rhododendri]
MQPRRRLPFGTRVHPRGARQRGFSLIEAVIALLIFSTGVLGIARLQSAAVQETSAAASRSTASLLAKNLISRMWMSDRTPATLAANFDNTSSQTVPGFAPWLAAVAGSGLPGVNVSTNTNLPTVRVSPVAGGGSSPVASSNVIVTVFWQAPGETQAHKYIETAQIK